MTVSKKKIIKIIKKKNIKYIQLVDLLLSNNKKTRKNTKIKKKTRKNYKKKRIRGGSSYIRTLYYNYLKLYSDAEIIKEICYTILSITNHEEHYPKLIDELTKIKKFKEKYKNIYDYLKRGKDLREIYEFYQSESFNFILEKIIELIKLWSKIDQRKNLYMILNIITKDDFELIKMPNSEIFSSFIISAEEKYEKLDTKLFDTLADSEENVTKLVNFLESLINILNADNFIYFYRQKKEEEEEEEKEMKGGDRILNSLRSSVQYIKNIGKIISKIYHTYLIVIEILKHEEHYGILIDELTNIQKLDITTDLNNYNKIQGLMNFYKSETFKFIYIKIFELINIWIDQRKKFDLILKAITTEEIELIKSYPKVEEAKISAEEKYEKLDTNIFDTLANSEENVKKLVDFLESLINILKAEGFSDFYKIKEERAKAKAEEAAKAKVEAIAKAKAEATAKAKAEEEAKKKEIKERLSNNDVIKMLKNKYGSHAVYMFNKKKK